MANLLCVTQFPSCQHYCYMGYVWLMNAFFLLVYCSKWFEDRSSRPQSNYWWCSSSCSATCTNDPKTLQTWQLRTAWINATIELAKAWDSMNPITLLKMHNHPPQHKHHESKLKREKVSWWKASTKPEKNRKEKK